MTADMSLVHLITGASFLVQMVMLLLLLISLISWALIFRKRNEIKEARQAVDVFESRFWSGISMDELHKQVTSKPGEMKGASTIFEAGFRTFVRLHQQEGIAPREVLDGTQRAMRVVLNREIDQLESHLPFLATVGSTSPYVGLFGTVWGIMNSFRALGNANQATLAMVALPRSRRWWPITVMSVMLIVWSIVTTTSSRSFRRFCIVRPIASVSEMHAISLALRAYG